MDHADKEGKTALFAAASMGHLEILNLLMFWGCYVDGIDCEGRTVLSVAAAEGKVSRDFYRYLSNSLTYLFDLELKKSIKVCFLEKLFSIYKMKVNQF